MKIIYLFYNIFILVIFSITFLSSFFFYRKTKKKIFQYVSVLFLFFIFDNLLIYFTEAITSFSKFFSEQFLTAPAMKTVVILTTFYCLMRINKIILNEKNSALLINLLICLGVILIFIPMLPDNAIKMWLYFAPCQIYTFVLGIHGLKNINKSTFLFDDKTKSNYRFILMWTVIFSILILIEDTIVIFNFDIYTDFLVKIRFRNFCEDIMSIGYSFFALLSLTKLLTIETANENTFNDNILESSILLHGNVTNSSFISSDPKESDKENKPGYISQDISFKETYDLENFRNFCSKYDFTNRECTCFNLLMLGKTNQEISDELVISLGTVKTHTHNLFRKCDVTNRRELKNLYSEYIKDLHDH